jgi:NAD(P)-dependent dehydrogenase (short-subunit alcohol dehydrogenase family)
VPLCAAEQEPSMSHRRVAIVTAAGRGLGEVIARTLAEDGYDLGLLSSGGGAVELASELDCLGTTGSVTEPHDLARLVHVVMERFGRVDVVVNNTGHAAKGPLLELTDADWHAGLDLLLLNVVRMARLVTPAMLDQGGGSFVNISTFSAYEPKAAFPVSSVIRAGLGSFTKLYADEHARHGIRMNNVLPGFFDTHPESEDDLTRIPVGRYASTREIADVVRFLASDDSSYLTGQNIRVDGGLTHSV